MTLAARRAGVGSGARHLTIERWLAAERRVDVVDLARRLGVAQETVRRDLRVLEEAGKLERVHGGAVALDAGSLAARPRVASNDQDDLELVAVAGSPAPADLSPFLAGGTTVSTAGSLSDLELSGALS